MRFLYTTFGLLLIASLVFGQSGREYRRYNFMDGNRVHTVFGNWGVIGQPAQEGRRGAWKYDENGYIVDFSIMIGAGLKHDSFDIASVEVCPVARPTSQPEISPTGTPWGFEPVAGYFNESQEHVAMSDEPSTWPSGWPEWPFDTEGATESYFVMDDNNDEEFNYPGYNRWGAEFKPDSNDIARNGLGLRVECRYRQFPFAGCEDILFMEYTIANEGTTPYKQVVFGGLNGTYVGCTAGDTRDQEYDDDVCFFDIANNATLFWDFDMDATRNPLWIENVGYAAIVLVQSPGNPYDGIDNDRDNGTSPGSSAPFFTASDFDARTIQAGEQIVLIDENYVRDILTVLDQAFEVTTCGETFIIVPGETVVQEGDLGNPNAYDGIDNDFDGLIDENYDLHYDFNTFHLNEPFEIENTLGPTQYIDYLTGQGQNDLLIDETGNNIDDVGLTSFDCFSPAFALAMGNDEELWDRLQPGIFSLTSSYTNGYLAQGEDGDYLFGSGYFPLYPDESQKVILGLVFADTPEELQQKVHILNMIDFNIQADPNLTLTAPSPGEYSGNFIVISWESDEAEGKVIIECTKDNGRSWQLVGNVDASQGNYTWDISDIPDGIFNRIRLRHAYKPWEASCSELFSINNPGQCSPQVMFTDSPEYGEIITGNLHISWIAGDADGDDISITLFYNTNSADTVWHQLASYSEAGTTNIVIDTEQHPNSENALLRVDVTNEFGTDSDLSQQFVISNAYDPLPENLSLHVSGNGSGKFEVHVVDSSALTGHQYKVTFHTDSESKSYDVQDLTTVEYVLINCTQLDSTAESPMFDGVRLLIHDIDPAQLDSNGSYWSDSTKMYDFTFEPVEVMLVGGEIIIGVRSPSDYEIQFFDDIVDTSSSIYGALAVPVNFKIYNITNERYIDFIFIDINLNQTLSPRDEIVFVEHGPGDSLILTWDMYFTSEDDTIYTYGPSDTLVIRTLKPFTSEDVFVFTTSPGVPVGLRGDVNADGTINVMDVLTVVNHILGIQELEGDALWRADCNDDGEVNVLDALGIVNVILGIGTCPPTGIVKISPAVIEYLKSLEPYFSPEDFARFMALVKAESTVPKEFALEQNYPNPFNPTTSIQYSVAGDHAPHHSQPVTLKIYNILGQEVRALVDEPKEPGYYSVTWDGRDRFGNDVASGVYFYRLIVGNGQWSKTKRMLLLK